MNTNSNKITGGSGTLTVVTQLSDELTNVLSAIEKSNYYWSISMRVEGGVVCFDIELGKLV